MITLSIGQGVKNTLASRVEVVDVDAFLSTREPEVEAWWSGHLWAGDRRSKDAWEATTCIVLDVDHCGSANNPKQRHTRPTPARRGDLEAHFVAEPLGSCWHHTPRGVRVIFALEEPCASVELLERATLGSAALVTEALRSAGVVARHDSKGRPIDGYAVDEATFDSARLYYAPNAIVDGEAREGRVFNGLCPTFSAGHLAELAESSSASSPSLEDDDIAVALAKMPADGEKDGSLELMRVARKAIGMGIETPEAFVIAVARWNAQRSQPWSAEDLATRFADAWERWSSEGRARVQMGKYRRDSVHKILLEDRAYAGRLTWDQLDLAVRLDGHVIGTSDYTEIEVDICARYGFPSISTDGLRGSLRAIAEKQPVNRVTDYLSTLEWDGVSRDEELINALHVVPEQRELAQTYMRKMRIAAIARAVEPGCKVDNMVVLLGLESMLKSQFWKALAGADNFSDSQIDLNNKDAYQLISKAWLYEWSEVEAITKRVDVARVRNFLSSAIDRYRAPYEANAADHARRGIIVGSSNSHDLIQDPDSNRRYWITELIEDTALSIDLGWVRAHRDQLWAEALVAYASGEAWWLPRAQEADRREVNMLYEPDRPMLDRLGVVADELARANNGVFSPRDLYIKLGFDPNGGNPAIYSLINSHLRRLGFTRTVITQSGRKARVYRKGQNVVSIETGKKGLTQ